MEWNDETIARLRALWAEGHSTAEIGRRMGVSKNAVVGKAHRLNLSSRPSPIRRDGSGGATRTPTPRRITGPTLPSMAVAQAPAIPSGPRPQRPATLAIPDAVMADSARAGASTNRLSDVAHGATPSVARAAPAPVRVVQTRTSRSVACCWPIGEPGTKSFRFCDGAAAAGKPYCSEHAAVAYVKVRDRREEAA